MAAAVALRTALHDLRCDLSAIRWLRGLGWTAGVIWVLGLILSAIFIGLLSEFVSSNSACVPDGSFRLHPDTYSMWSSSGFFQITLGGGKLSFAQAKVVDVVWDIIQCVGRGGQLLLAIISWRVFARYLTICMETEPVTYRVFRTIFIESDVSILSTCRTIKSFVRQRGLRSKVAMVFMAATMVFVLAFPTLMSAMSGYDANVGSRILDLEDNLIPFSNYSRAAYMIHDASRINKTNDYWIMLDEGRGKDVRKYGLGGARNESSIIYGSSSRTNFTIPAPVLNISAYATGDERQRGQSSLELRNTTWVRENKTFDMAYIERNGRCQNTGVHRSLDYQWGFSFLQLFVCILLLLGWTIGIYVMWIYTHYTMQLRQRLAEEVSGEYRAVLELAAAMQSELDIDDTDVSFLREKQLEERIEKEIRGGAVAYAYPSSSSSSASSLKLHSIRSALKKWFRREKAVCSTFWLVPALWYGSGTWWLWVWSWLWSVWFGQFWAFCIGTKTGSRLLIIAFWSLVGGLAVGITAGVLSAKEDYYY
ncbi:hypothetical protein SVAN01_09047 [Stagonosporopsis vannaccii]|nr:hypothetical protein SVAN01_09047 [Stagonosporopsis vannaccii]